MVVILIGWLALASLCGIMKDINEEGRVKERKLNELKNKIFNHGHYDTQRSNRTPTNRFRIL